MGSILNTPYYTANIAYWYQQAFVFESFSLMFLAYRLAMALRVFRSVDIILKSIETVIYFAITFQALGIVAAFLLFIGIIMIGMTIIAMNVWGPYLIQFKNFSDAFLSITYFQMGLLNFESLKNYSMIWTFIYFIVYCVFIIYILMSSFMIIFIDSFRRVNIQYNSLSAVMTSGPHHDHNIF